MPFVGQAVSFKISHSGGKLIKRRRQKVRKAICLYDLLSRLLIWPNLTTRSLGAMLMKQIIPQPFYVSMCNLHTCKFSFRFQLGYPSDSLPAQLTVWEVERGFPRCEWPWVLLPWKLKVTCAHLSTVMSTSGLCLVFTPLSSTESLLQAQPQRGPSPITAGKLAESHCYYCYS